MASMDATASRHVSGELYYEHQGEARGLQARQYAYGIGSNHSRLRASAHAPGTDDACQRSTWPQR